MSEEEFYKEKTICFKLNSKSKNQINFSGMVVSIRGIKQPNIKETFKVSIKELVSETKLKLKFIENSERISDKDFLIIDTDISEINWHFDFSVSTLRTLVKYTNTHNNNEIITTGVRKSGGGNEMNNLKKSLKDAVFNFLKEFEKQ